MDSVLYIREEGNHKIKKNTHIVFDTCALKLRVVLEREKVSPKESEHAIFFIYSIDSLKCHVKYQPNSTTERIKVVDYEGLETDPGIRPPISNYHPDIQDEVRKAYLKIGRHQPPSNFVYPWSDHGGQRHLAFCLPCFLFKNVFKSGGDHFVGDGFGDWKNAQRLTNHATSNNSHVDCVHMGYALMNPNQSINATFLVLLLLVATASVECVFSAIKVVKSQLCNTMNDRWLNDRLVTFIERGVLLTIINVVILAHF
ncbi:transmembrane protein, putative [Medicago truncatula]|uniref:Transmembrane protein, putative n=1 Tax=Medicago truncatula TaxID=3880 RepID=G7KZI0_MEDTR|nr:transmembrane protein, putative [Medicago truncatula]